MAYRGHIENGTVVLDEPVDIPDGTAVTVEPEHPSAKTAVQLLSELADLFPREDLNEIENAVNSCRKVDRDGW